MYQARKPPRQSIRTCSKVDNMAALQGNIRRHTEANLRLCRAGGACELCDICRAKTTAEKCIQRCTARRQGCATSPVVTACELVSGAAARRKMLSHFALELQDLRALQLQ